MYLRPLQAALLLACPAVVFANQATENLDSVIITATRTAQTADETLASTTVITRQDIERQQAHSIQDLLRGAPGLSVSNSGGAGKATSLFLRGTESDHVLVLVDGIKVGSATAGTTAFQDIPVDLIERIEIVRGPRSSLYGSEAIGGVIQIFTRKGGRGIEPAFSIGGGSFGTYQVAGGVSGGDGQSWFSAHLSGTDTKGFNACEGKPSPGGAGCFTIEPDDDGYRNLSGTLRAGKRFNNTLEADVHWLRAKGDNEFDGTFVNESESVQHVIGGRLVALPSERWQMTLAGGQSRDESDNFKNGVLMSRFDTQRDSAAWQNDLDFSGAQTLTAGLDWQNDRVDSDTAYAVTSRDNTALFAQYRRAFGAHDAQISVRRDDNEQFGGHNTGGAAWGYAMAAGFRVTATYGTAFKAPTFNELYFPGFGNANLRPEESRSIELGIASKTDRLNWSINVYESRVDDLIAFDAAISAPNNIDEARILGLEAILTTHWQSWNIATNVTLLDPENRAAGANNAKVLPRRAERALRLAADRALGRYSLGATLLAEGPRYDDLANTRELGGFGTLDLRGEYALTNDWSLQGRIANLLDKNYQTAAFFNQPERSFFVTLRYRP